MNGIILPIKLPFVFEESVGLKLPTKLPFMLGVNQNRKSIKLNTVLTCFYANEQKNIRLPITENAKTTLIKFPITEQSWDFVGIIIEENIVDLMEKTLVLIEDIKQRIMVEVEMLNRNQIKIKWFGDSVPKIEILKKNAVDEEYQKISEHEWSEGYSIIELDNSEYDLLVQGINSTGTSGVINLSETNSTDIETDINVFINEKVYSYDLDFASKYRIDINF